MAGRNKKPGALKGLKMGELKLKLADLKGLKLGTSEHRSVVAQLDPSCFVYYQPNQMLHLKDIEPSTRQDANFDQLAEDINEKTCCGVEIRRLDKHSRIPWTGAAQMEMFRFMATHHHNPDKPNHKRIEELLLPTLNIVCLGHDKQDILYDKLLEKMKSSANKIVMWAYPYPDRDPHPRTNASLRYDPYTTTWLNADWDGQIAPPADLLDRGKGEGTDGVQADLEGLSINKGQSLVKSSHPAAVALRTRAAETVRRQGEIRDDRLDDPHRIVAARSLLGPGQSLIKDDNPLPPLDDNERMSLTGYDAHGSSSRTSDGKNDTACSAPFKNDEPRSASLSALPDKGRSITGTAAPAKTSVPDKSTPLNSTAQPSSSNGHDPTQTTRPTTARRPVDEPAAVDEEWLSDVEIKARLKAIGETRRDYEEAHAHYRALYEELMEMLKHQDRLHEIYSKQPAEGQAQ